MFHPYPADHEGNQTEERKIPGHTKLIPFFDHSLLGSVNDERGDFL